MTHPLDIPAIFITAMGYTDCLDAPSATQSANLSGTTVVVADCEGLAIAIAAHQVAAWKAVLPEIVETRLDTDHDDMVQSEGREIARLIIELFESVRASL